MITVWGRPNSLNTQKVLWALAELGLDFRRIDAGMQYGVVGTPEYRALNPNGLVPTIDDDGFILWESNVIVRYLASKYGEGTLCPRDPKERFLAERWMDWQATALFPALNPGFLQIIRTPAEKRDDAIVAHSVRQTDHWLAILEAQLASRAYLNGPAFTMADISVGASVNRWFGLPRERAPHPAVEAWFARLRERPCFKAQVEGPLS